VAEGRAEGSITPPWKGKRGERGEEGRKRTEEPESRSPSCMPVPRGVQPVTKRSRAGEGRGGSGPCPVGAHEADGLFEEGAIFGALGSK